MNPLLLSLLILFSTASLQAEETATSLLTDAVKQEIAERAKNEAMEREARREKERLARYKQDLERQAADIRRRAEQARVQQQKWAAQLQALSRENAVLQNREAELKRQLVETENQAAAREAEALKTRTELETLRQKLTESNLALEERRKATVTKMEQDRLATVKHGEEIKKLQDELAKADSARHEHEKQVAVTQAEAAAMEKKLNDMKAEKSGKPVVEKASEVRKAASAMAAPSPSTRSWKLSKLCNLYEKADASSAKLAKIPQGAAVPLMSETGEFVKTAFKGSEGYVRKICGQAE